MKIYKLIEKICLSIINSCWIFFIRIHEKKNILKKRKIYKNIKLTKGQKQQIDNYFKKTYGKKISYKWHRLYTAYTGNFDYKYFPEYLFSTRLDNNRIKVLEFENKALLNKLFDNVSNYIYIPKLYIKKINGHYYDEDDNPIFEKEAINIIKEKYNNFIIKKSIDSNSGRGVKIISLKKDNIDLKELFNSFGKNFIIEELIKQSKIVNKIYDKSINTLRIVTYQTDSGYYVAPITMRIGRGGNDIDNAHAGGIFIAVDNQGYLGKKAFTEYNEQFLNHPDTNLKFNNYKLPNIELLREEIIKLHKQLPNIKFISWDVAINEDNFFSLIEINLHSQAVWLQQMAHGKGFFQENTDNILNNLRR